jgi:uncharacterized membrane protein
MTVHFPIVLMFMVSLFNVLYVISGVKSLEITALHCLAVGILFLPIVILTGLFSWWLNYMAKPLTPVNVKITLSTVTFLVAIIIFTCHAGNS